MRSSFSHEGDTKATVLVVDDYDMTRGFFERTLKRLGYTVLTASNPKQAIKLFGGRPIDGLLTDIDQPDGHKLANELMANGSGLRVMYTSEKAKRLANIPTHQALKKPEGFRNLKEKLSYFG